MYKVNKETKIGKRIDELIKQEGLDVLFKHTEVSFLTKENDAKGKYNVHIYSNNRLANLQKQIDDESVGDGIYIPGCITNCIMEEFSNSNELNSIINSKKLDIKIVFGKDAASSRASNTPKTYPINSHSQLEEIKYLLNCEELNIEHSYNPIVNDTNFNINGYKFTMNTVEATSLVALYSIVGWMNSIK